MKHDEQLKLQAYLDGELPAAEAAEVENWLASDGELQALMRELRNTTCVLAGHEADCRLPETREFFWSKIEREIERQSAPARPAQRQSWFAWVNRHLIPVSGVALMMLLCGILAIRPGETEAAMSGTEMASDDMSSYTFRDQEQGMTMVWIYDRNEDSPSAEKTSAADAAPK